LLAPWRGIIASLNGEGPVRRYPGSPEIAARMMRGGDRLIANELHPEECAALAAHFRRDRRVTVLRLDASVCVKANLPPPERRGVVLIDPPYEEKGEAGNAARMIEGGLARFASGVFVLWYPVKGKGDEEACIAAAKALAMPGTLTAQLRVREAFKEGGLAGSGVIVVNAPWKLDEELALILPALAERLGLGRWGQGTVAWVTPPA
jgi:23S rRNA (adenine2030-N6)-methyltransferase